MAPSKQQQSNTMVFIDATPPSSTPTKKTTKQRSTTPIKSPAKNTIMNFFTKKQQPTIVAPPPTIIATNLSNHQPIDTISIVSEDDVIMIDSSSQESMAKDIAMEKIDIPNHNNTMMMVMMNTCSISSSNKPSSVISTTPTKNNEKKRKFSLSPSSEDEKKENIDPKQLNKISSPKKKKLKETIATTDNKSTTTIAATSISTSSDKTSTSNSSDKTPTSVEECEELIQQLVDEVKNLKPSLDDTKKLRKDEKVRKYLKKLFQFCQTNKEFQSNKNTYPFKPAFINLLTAYCQGVASLDIDELIQDVRKSWIKISIKKQLVTGTSDETTIDNLLPTIDAMKNAINLHLERKIYGVKDLCEINVWEARKLSSLTTKLGSTARDCATLAKQMRNNFKKIAETKGKEINKLQKLKAKLEKQAAKETKKETKKESKKESKKEAKKDATLNATLTSPKKNKQTVKCKSITLFTQKCNILKEDKVVSAPVCRVQSGKTTEEIDLAIAAQNYPVSLKETIASMKKNPLKKSKVAFKFISLFGKVHTFKKDDEECQSTVVNGRKPLAKDPNMSYPEEDEEEMEELVLGEADLAVEGECLDSEDDDGEELEFDSEDDSGSMEEDNICADDIIEYEDGKIEHVETSEISKDQQKKKKRQQLSDLDPIFECSNQLQEVTFTVDEDFTFDISELNCNHVFWWQNQPEKSQKKNSEPETKTVTIDVSNADKMDTTPDGTITTSEPTEKKKKSKKPQNGEIKFVNQTDSFTSPSKDVWEAVQMEYLKSVLDTCGTKPEIVTAMLQKYPSLSKNRVNKKIKEIIVKEKRDGDSKTKFYMKE